MNELTFFGLLLIATGLRFLHLYAEYRRALARQARAEWMSHFI